MKTYAELNLNALSDNIATYKGILPEKTKIIAVVKANAYGHGIVQISQKAIECGADMLAIAQPEEGELLRSNGITSPIVVMGGMLPEDMETIVEQDLIPFIYTTSQLRMLENYAAKADKVAKFHLKIETGMNRIGILPGEDLEEFITVLDECKYVKLAAVCSHFANADELNKDYASQQYKNFVQGVKQVREGDHLPKVHIANSAAAASCDFSRLDYIRLGVSMYGLQSEEMEKLELTPVMSLKTKVINIKTIKKGETVGYSRNYEAKDNVVVATLPIGYADGFRRSLGNKGEVLIRGKRAKVIGNVCMDHAMVDVTGIDDVQIGDEVVIIGKQNADEIKADEVAKWTDTIHYEIVTCIGQRVPRIYIDE